MVACTTDWFAAHMTEEIETGRGYLFMRRYDYPALKRYIETYCDSCDGESRRIVATKLSRLGQWEFEEYRLLSN